MPTASPSAPTTRLFSTTIAGSLPKPFWLAETITIGQALQFVPRAKLFPCTNCGMAPMNRDIAIRKLQALASGSAIARERYR